MGYKQIEVARLCGMKNTSRLSLWERGDSIPSIINLLKLSIVYQTLPTEFYFELYLDLKVEIQKNRKSPSK